ncbi:MAG TPA: Ig-like domain-containing protein [Gemmatimonadaceae bacterium]|nr:Ig-like domain-containing protein [Gemmatimonadaceae bacterium]
MLKRTFVFACLLAAIACATDTATAPVATTIVKIGTDPTSVVAGASFADSVRVRVTDGSGNPKSGVSVAFAVTAGGGSVTPATVSTDANGKAAAKFITGTTVGTNTATATVTGLTPVTFSILTTAAAASVVVKFGTDPSIVVAGASFADSIRVRVTDAANNPKAGMSVDFAVTAGGGSVTPAQVITDANGKAAAKFITGTTVGTNTATASVAGLTPVTFSITTASPDATFIAKIGTDPSIVVAGASFADSIRVRVTDAASNPKAGVSVAFAVTAGGGSVTPVTVITDANGKAAAKFITGTTAGANTATATVTGLTPVAFSTTTIPAGTTLVWSSVPSGTTQPLHGVWGTAASDVWAVGGNGTILHYDGTAWSTAPSGTTRFLYAVWGTSASNAWAVGDNGTILHYDGTAWSTAPSGTTQPLHGVWGTAASNAWAVGGNGTILHYDGTAWSTAPSGTTELLLGVWGTSASDVWVAGGDYYSGGTILHYNGASWSASASGAIPGAWAVWGTSASNVWAVGNAFYSGWFIHYNGSSWSTAGSTGLNQYLLGIWGSSASDAWAVGYNGQILHYDGAIWSSVSSGTAQELDGVWGTSAANVWAVGAGGVIVHRSPAP